AGARRLGAHIERSVGALHTVLRLVTAYWLDELLGDPDRAWLGVDKPPDVAIGGLDRLSRDLEDLLGEIDDHDVMAEAGSGTPVQTVRHNPVAVVRILGACGSQASSERQRAGDHAGSDRGLQELSTIHGTCLLVSSLR